MLILLLFLNVKAEITYQYENHKQQAEIIVKALFGLIRFKIKIPSAKNKDDTTYSNEKQNASDAKKNTKKQTKEDEALNPLNKVNNFVQYLPEIYKIVKTFLKKVQIRRFAWTSIIGTGDAAQTGVISGAGWAIKGSVLGVISHYLSLRVYPLIEIKPDFQRSVSNTYLKCMIQVRVGHAMLAGMKLLKYWRKMKKQQKLSAPSNNHSIQKEDQIS